MLGDRAAIKDARRLDRFDIVVRLQKGRGAGDVLVGPV
jgi:hypothetical protein